MRIEILGIPIDAVTETEARTRLRELLAEPCGHLVTTPNPEMLVLAAKDQHFKNVLRESDLAVPDGVGLGLAARWVGKRLPTRITGADFVHHVAVEAADGKSLYLLGAAEGIAESAAAKLVEVHPGLRIAGAASGGKVTRDARGVPAVAADEFAKIVAAAPDILLVAFGHGTQEEWIAENLKRLPSVRVAMGVGGTFDFLAGKAKRAPKWLRLIGLEWFWRLITEPWRWRRIWTAVAVFPYLVMTEKR